MSLSKEMEAVLGNCPTNSFGWVCLLLFALWEGGSEGGRRLIIYSCIVSFSYYYYVIFLAEVGFSFFLIFFREVT